MNKIICKNKIKTRGKRMWILLAFASAIMAGLTAILAKIGIKDIDSNVATAIRTIVILLFAWIMVFIVGSFDTISEVSKKSLAFLVLSGMATGGSWLCYFKALQLGEVNKVTPIDKSSTVLSMIFAFTILGEAITVTKVIGMIGIGIGTYLMITKTKGEMKEVNGSKWMAYALLSAIFASLTSILGKIGIANVESNLGTAIRTIVVLIMAWILVFVSKKQNQIKKINKRNWTFLCLSGVTTGLSWLLYYKALKDGQACIVVPIDKLSILVTVSFSYFILHEKLTKKSLIGLCMVVSATFILIV